MLVAGMLNNLRFERAVSLQVLFLLLQQLGKAHAPAALDFLVPEHNVNVTHALLQLYSPVDGVDGDAGLQKRVSFRRCAACTRAPHPVLLHLVRRVQCRLKSQFRCKNITF